MINSLKKMFGGSKSYYLELEPAEQGQAAPRQAPAVEAVATEQPAAKPVAPAAKEATPQQPVAQPAPQPPAPTPQPAPAAPAEPVATAFASSYLLPVTSLPSRRRPGPSMSKFLDMARDFQPRR